MFLLTVSVHHVLIMLCSSQMYLWSWCIWFMAIVDPLMFFVCCVLINTSHVPLICSGGCFFVYKYPLLELYVELLRSFATVNAPSYSA